jgi:hypothetical protein
MKPEANPNLVRGLLAAHPKMSRLSTMTMKTFVSREKDRTPGYDYVMRFGQRLEAHSLGTSTPSATVRTTGLGALANQARIVWTSAVRMGARRFPRRALVMAGVGFARTRMPRQVRSAEPRDRVKDKPQQTNIIEVSPTTTQVILDGWGRYIEKLRAARATIVKHHTQLGPALDQAVIPSPNRAEAAAFASSKLSQLIQTLALDRQRADLVGKFPITFGGEFIPEVRRTIVDLLPVPAENQSFLLQSVYQDLVTNATSGHVNGPWGYLVSEQGQLVFVIAPRKPSNRLQTEPHLASGWQPLAR